jgi:hypothetical protein
MHSRRYSWDGEILTVLQNEPKKKILSVTMFWSNFSGNSKGKQWALEEGNIFPA